MDEVLELLTKGRDYFADHEWERGGDYFTYDLEGQIRSCCAQGALIGVRDADKITTAFGNVFSTARELLAGEVPVGGYSLVHYNDHFAESKDDILALFDRAIAARRSE